LLAGFFILLFAAPILLLEALWIWWSAAHGSAARRISKRLRLMAAQGEPRRTYRHPQAAQL
jgi:tight adherence protein B